MHAVFLTGGQQYRVQVGQTVEVEKLDHEVGANIDFSQVKLISDGDKTLIGTPSLDAKVSAVIVEHKRGDKIKIIKFRRRKHSMTRQGHRQWRTVIKITGIEA